MSVLDRLGTALCDMGPLHLPDGVHLRGGRVVLAVPALDYAALVDAMFGLIRQNADGSAAVLGRLVAVLTAVVTCERDPARQAELARHADLVLEDGEREIANSADLNDLRRRHAAFRAAVARGPLAAL